MIVVLLITVTPKAAVPPKVTVAPSTKSVPVKVTRVPPDVGPVAGATDVTGGGIGGGTGDPVSTVLKSEQTIPSSGVVKVARTPTTPLGGIDFVIVALVGGSAASAVVFQACGVPEDELLIQASIEMPEDLVSGLEHLAHV